MATEQDTPTQVIAAIDDPGNSTGPQLHLDAAVRLYDDQERRAMACERARNIIQARTLVAGHSVEPMDVYLLAEYILTGRDPWNSARTVDEPAG